MSNFLKVVPLWAISNAMSHDASKGPRGGLPVLYKSIGPMRSDSVEVTRTTREWMNGFLESTETMFKEIQWELTLEGK